MDHMIGYDVIRYDMICRVIQLSTFICVYKHTNACDKHVCRRQREAVLVDDRYDVRWNTLGVAAVSSPYAHLHMGHTPHFYCHFVQVITVIPIIMCGAVKTLVRASRRPIVSFTYFYLIRYAERTSS